MAYAPYGFRLLVCAATLAVEETIKLPHTILMYPMTLASQAAHLVMRFQQNLAELAIKGDSTLESIFPPKDENPEWATFDEDLPDAIVGDPYALADGLDGDRRAEGCVQRNRHRADHRPLRRHRPDRRLLFPKSAKYRAGEAGL